MILQPGDSFFTPAINTYNVQHLLNELTCVFRFSKGSTDKSQRSSRFDLNLSQNNYEFVTHHSVYFISFNCSYMPNEKKRDFFYRTLLLPPPPINCYEELAQINVPSTRDMNESCILISVNLKL